MRCFIMTLLKLAVHISRGVGWPPRKVCTTAMLSTTSQYKLINENKALILGIAPPSLTASSMALSWNNNGTTDRPWQFTSIGSGYDEISQPLISLFV